MIRAALVSLAVLTATPVLAECPTHWAAFLGTGVQSPRIVDAIRTETGVVYVYDLRPVAGDRAKIFVFAEFTPTQCLDDVYVLANFTNGMPGVEARFSLHHYRLGGHATLEVYEAEPSYADVKARVSQELTLPEE